MQDKTATGIVLGIQAVVIGLLDTLTQKGVLSSKEVTAAIHQAGKHISSPRNPLVGDTAISGAAVATIAAIQREFLALARSH